MVFDLIYEQLVEIIGTKFNWLTNATGILSFILTVIYILIFVSIPTYIFISIFKLPSVIVDKKRKKSKWN